MDALIVCQYSRAALAALFNLCLANGATESRRRAVHSIPRPIPLLTTSANFSGSSPFRSHILLPLALYNN